MHEGVHASVEERHRSAHCLFSPNFCKKSLQRALHPNSEFTRCERAQAINSTSGSLPGRVAHKLEL